MKRFFMFFIMLLLIVPILVLAQEAVDPDFPFPVNDAIVAAIQTIFGIGLMAIVQFAKTGIKKIIPNYDKWSTVARHALMYGVTLLIAGGATYFVLTSMKVMALDKFIFYTVYTWGYINQFWKMLKEIINKVKATA